MTALREPQAVRWVRRGRAFRLIRAPQGATPGGGVAVRIPAYRRPACPLSTILLATFAPFGVAILGWLAYLLR